MLTPHCDHYGYGWFIDTLYDRVHTYHGGFLDGFNTSFERWPDERLCVIVFSNEDVAPVDKIARSLAAIAFRRHYDFPVRKAPGVIDTVFYHEYVGAYRIADSLLRRITVENGALTTYVEGELPELLLPQAVDTFFFDSDNTKTLRFVRDTAGQVTAYVLTTEGESYFAEKTRDVSAREAFLTHVQSSLDPAELEQFVGIYELDPSFSASEKKVLLVIRRDGLKLYAAAAGAPEILLLPFSATEFRHDVDDFSIEFLRADTGLVVECVLRFNNQTVHGRRRQ
jgi:hypothetical protein